MVKATSGAVMVRGLILVIVDRIGVVKVPRVKATRFLGAWQRRKKVFLLDHIVFRLLSF